MGFEAICLTRSLSERDGEQDRSESRHSELARTEARVSKDSRRTLDMMLPNPEAGPCIG